MSYEDLTLPEVEEMLYIKFLGKALAELWKDKREEFKHTHTEKLYREHLNNKVKWIFEGDNED